MIVESHSVEETLQLGHRLGQAAAQLPGTICIALDGPLGAGKTHLTRGIAQGAGVVDLSLVCSPTYVLLNIYDAPPRGRVYHFDAYRVANSHDFEELGFQEILQNPGIIIVEWASRVADLLPSDTLWITLDHAENDHRLLTLNPTSHLSRQLASTIK